MKKSKIFKLFMIMCIALLGTREVMASVLENNITIASSNRTISYLVQGSNMGVNFRKTNSGTVVYCLDYEKTSPGVGTTFTKGTALDAGLTYLVANGYPNKSITGDANKDFYITQLAIWWYQGDFYGHKLSTTVTNLKNGVYNSNPVSTYIRNLYNGAVTARNAGYVTPTLSLSQDNVTLSLDSTGSYYVSNLISVKTSGNIDTYNVALKNATVDVMITNQSGQKANTMNVNEGFYIKVPAGSVKGKTISFAVNVTANGIKYLNKILLQNKNYQELH